MRKILLPFLLFVPTMIQAQIESLKTSANNVWGYFQLGVTFIIVMTFIIGAVIVYNAKSNANPEEFKKKLLNFIYGLLFLFFALGMLTVIKTVINTSLSISPM